MFIEDLLRSTLEQCLVATEGMSVAEVKEWRAALSTSFAKEIRDEGWWPYILGAAEIRDHESRLARREQRNNAPQQLYRWYDADDNLLYVGISFHALFRAAQHRYTADWWPLAAKMTIVNYPNRAAVEEAELRIIATENPRYNRAGIDQADK